VLPKPAHDIPSWVGGSSEPAYRRAVGRGDGFQAIGLKPDTAVPVVERIRRDRPDPSFTISLRTGWDPQGMEPDEIKRESAEFEAAGIQYVVSDADAVDTAAKAHGVVVEKPLTEFSNGALRTIWLEDPDGTTNYFAETATSRRARTH